MANIIRHVLSFRTLLIIKIWKRIARKLCIIIFLQFRLVTFGIHFRKTWKVIDLLVFGPSGRDHNSQNQYFIFGDTEILQIIQGTQSPSQFEQISRREISNIGKSNILEIVEKMGADKS